MQTEYDNVDMLQYQQIKIFFVLYNQLWAK